MERASRIGIKLQNKLAPTGKGREAYDDSKKGSCKSDQIFLQSKSISVAEAERKCGYSVGMISSRWASSSGDFGVLSKLTILAEVLGVSTDELLGLSSEPVHEKPPAANAGSSELLFAGTVRSKIKWGKTWLG